MALKEDQEELRRLLQRKFRTGCEAEWRTRMNTGLYSPRLDVAAGPFSIENGVHLTDNYNELFNANVPVIRDFAITHLINIGSIGEQTSNNERDELIESKLRHLYNFNPNARCFIAIEIENNVSRKHLMGGAINASFLGRIAIAVGYTDEKHRAFLNLFRYLAFLQDVKKPSMTMHNILIISMHQLRQILRKRSH